VAPGDPCHFWYCLRKQPPPGLHLRRFDDAWKVKLLPLYPNPESFPRNIAQSSDYLDSAGKQEKHLLKESLLMFT